MSGGNGYDADKNGEEQGGSMLKYLLMVISIRVGLAVEEQGRAFQAMIARKVKS